MNLQLRENEQIVLRGTPSKEALIITWLAGPALILVNIILNFLGTIRLFKLIAFLKILFIVPSILLIIAWIGVCLMMTYRHFQYELIVTDCRVIGRAGKEEMDVPLNEIVNVHTEQSIWGKLLHYGSIVVQTKKKTLTFKSLKDPKEMHKLLMSYAEKY